MNSGDRMATQKGFYVEISRARDEAVLITDNRVALARNIAENTGVQVNALSNKLDGFFQKPEVDAVRAVSRAAKLGEVITARTAREETSGTFETIDDAGNLVLKTAKGKVTIPAADIFF